MNARTNYLTLDIEEWYHVNYEGLPAAGDSHGPTNLEALVDRLIALCARHNVRSTFFVLGVVAQKKPQIVRNITAGGHEVASHGFAHRSLRGMTPEEFREDLTRSCDAIEQITGTKARGFRAPSFSVTRKILEWYYPILEQEGLTYSSSVFPGQTFLYGIPDFPPEAHYPVIGGRRTSILEIPVPRVRLFGKDMGLYVRLFPAWYIRRKLYTENLADRSVVLYVHPREIDPEQPRLKLPPIEGLIHYWGVARCEQRLDAVLAGSGGRFGRLCDCATAEASRNG